MRSYYRSLSLKIKSNKNSIKEIVEWLNENYVFDSEDLEVNEKEKRFEFSGEETDPFLKNIKSNNKMPDAEDIFKDISIAFPNLEYRGYAKIEGEYFENEEYFINCENGVLKIERPVIAIICNMYEYEEYEEFCEDYDVEISEEEFNEYQKEDIVYIYDNKLYTEKEYYDIPYHVLLCENISDLISASKEENIDTKNLLEKIEEHADNMEKVPENLKNNRNFVLEAVRKNGFAITYLNNDLALDRKIALEAVKNDPYVIDFLDDKFEDDDELQELAEELLNSIAEEENN